MSEFEKENDDRTKEYLADELGNSDQNLKESINTLENNPQTNVQSDKVKSIMDQYLNQQLPQADSFMLNAAVNKMEPGATSIDDEDFYKQYQEMIDDKAEALILDVIKPILTIEKKWNISFQGVNSKQLYDKLAPEDQIKYHDLFKATEHWRTETKNLFKKENYTLLERQVLNKLKLGLGMMSNPIITLNDDKEKPIYRERQAINQLYQNVKMPAYVSRIVLYDPIKNNNKEMFTIDHSDILGSYLKESIQHIIFNDHKSSNYLTGDLLDIVQNLPEKVEEFTKRANQLIEAYGIINQAMNIVREENNKMPDLAKFNEFIETIMPAMLNFSPEVLHHNQMNLSRQLADSISKAVKFFSLGSQLKIDKSKIEKIAKKVSNYHIEDVKIKNEEEIKRNSLSANPTSTANRDSINPTAKETQRSKLTSKSMQLLSTSNVTLENLVNRYRDLENKVHRDYANFNDKQKEINILNKEFFELSLSEGTQLTVNNLSTAPKYISIPDLASRTDVTYSAAGNPPTNGIVMGHTANGQIYVDENQSNINKFSGLVFVERINEKTGEILDVKDAICFKDGKIIDFIEAPEGKSRLGQLEKLKQKSLSNVIENSSIQKGTLQKETLQRETLAQDTPSVATSSEDRRKMARSQSGYEIEGIRWLVDSISDKVSKETKAKDQTKINEMKKFIKQELNEYAGLNREQRSSIEDMILGPGTTDKMKHFIDMASNVIINSEKLNEGMIVNRAQVFFNNIPQESTMETGVKKFDANASTKLNDQELNYVIDGLDKNNKIIMDNKFQLVQDHGNHNVFIEELGNIIASNNLHKTNNKIVSPSELKLLNLQDPAHLRLYENTLKAIDEHNNISVNQAIKKAIIAKNNEQVNQPEVVKQSQKQVFEKLVPEQSTVLTPPPMPQTPKLVKNANVAEKNLQGQNVLPNREQPEYKPTSILKPISNQPVQDKPKKQVRFREDNLESSQSVNIPKTIEEAKTPEQVRQFMEYEAQQDQREERQARDEARTEFIANRNQPVQIKTPEDLEKIREESRKQARNEPGYTMKSLDLLANDILTEVVGKTKLKDKVKTENLRKFIKQELNEYASDNRDNRIGNIMDIIHLPEIKSRRENLIIFIGNELSRNVDHLTEGMLINKMDFFSDNLLLDHVGEQKINTFKPITNKKLSDKELGYILTNLDSSNNLLADNKLKINLIKEYGSSEVFIKLLAKIVHDKGLTPKIDKVLSIPELKVIDLKNPEHQKLLENTLEVINERDPKALSVALKLSIIKEHIGKFDPSQIDPSNISPKTPSLRNKDDSQKR